MVTVDDNLPEPTNPVVDTTYGPVRGVDDGRVRVFKGVRYGAPPVGEWRWRAPQPPEPWTDVADATAYGGICPQPVLPALPLGSTARMDEDCLFLNVWAASGTDVGAAKPVMVWVHGGAYVYGAGSQPLYSGRALVENDDVIVVTVNYRLGALGWLDLSSFGTDDCRFDTNLGLRDVLAALHWVRANIAAFGGDPSRVTLFGESAGAGVVTTLLTSPAADGLFAAAIAQSSPVTSVYDGARARRNAELILDHLGIDYDDVDTWRDTPVEEIVAATAAIFESVPVNTPGTLGFAPIVDGDIVPDYPIQLARQGKSLPVPLLIGTNKDEAALFRWMKSPLMPITPDAIKSMFEGLAADQPGLQLPTEEQIGAAYAGMRAKAAGMGLARDVGFRMPSVWLAEGHSQVAPVYLYRFDWTTPMLRLLRIGATHATELPYVWGNLVLGPRDITFKLGGLKSGTAVSERMRARWLHFATDTKPNGGYGEPDWLPYQLSDRACLVIDKQDSVVNDIDHPIRAAFGTEVLSFR